MAWTASVTATSGCRSDGTDRYRHYGSRGVHVLRYIGRLRCRQHVSKCALASPTTIGNSETLTSASTASVAGQAQHAGHRNANHQRHRPGQVGETLTVDTSGITDADGLDNVVFSYQWVRTDGTTDTDITGATGSTYTLVLADQGKTVNVRVTFTDDADNGETLVSSETATVAAGTETVTSPDGHIQVGLTLIDGDLHYIVSFDGVRLLDQSAVGIAFSDSRDGGDVTVVGTTRRTVDTTWRPTWGKSSEVADEFNEITVQLQEVAVGGRRFDVVFRTYDDGVAFRYSVESQPGLSDGDSLAERTEFNFAADWPVHAVTRVERPPDGTRTTADFKSSNTPMLVLADPAVVAVHEAALLDYPPMFLKGGDDHPNLILAHVRSVDFEGSLLTPWRVLMVASDVGRLLEAQLLETLSPSLRVSNPAFVQPGKAIFDRRIRKLTYNGLYYWLNTATYLHLIDFAADNNIAYLAIDSGWYGDQRSVSSNPVIAQNGIDIEQILNHAVDRGVGVFLYVNDRAFDYHNMENVFRIYSDWGAAGIKYGFMRGDSRGQAKVVKTTGIIEAAARHDLMINFHDGPVHPTGLSRTYPNLIATQYCHGQLDAIRSFTPRDYLRTIFVHMLAGPLDMINGYFGLDSITDRRNGGFGYNRRYPPIDSTVATEVARILITDTGLTVLPDAPEEYARKDDLFEFVRAMPNGPWDETRVLHAEFGEYVTVAKRHGREWFVGSVINDEVGSLDIDLGFLEDGTTYAATIYANASDSHYQTNREAYQIQQTVSDSDDILNAVMVPGGGHAVWLRPQSAPQFTSAAAFEVAENTDTFTTPRVIPVRAEESGSRYRISGYEIVGGVDADLFTITDGGDLSFVSTPDYETPLDAAGTNTYVVRIKATGHLNTESTAALQTVTVTVTDIDEPNTPASGTPMIGGTAQVGETLTVDTSGISDADGLDNVSFSYQWVRNDGTSDSDITGATASTYTLVSADQGKTVKVRVSFTDDASNSETRTSAFTASVAPRPNTPATGTPTISGTAGVGETLTVDTSGISDADGLTTSCSATSG